MYVLLGQRCFFFLFVCLFICVTTIVLQRQSGHIALNSSECAGFFSRSIHRFLPFVAIFADLYGEMVFGNDASREKKTSQINGKRSSKSKIAMGFIYHIACVAIDQWHENGRNHMYIELSTVVSFYLNVCV